MNIDIVNKHVADKKGMKETKVRLINQFYWRQVYNHLYSFNSQPVNIENVCVLYPNKYMIKKAIRLYIRKIRNVQTGGKFKEGSVKQLDYLEKYKTTLRGYLKLRKENKFTN